MSGPEPAVLIDVVGRFEGLFDEALIERSVLQAMQAAMTDASTELNAKAPHSWQQAEVSIRITDDAEMHRMNLEYRGIDKPTDVLSFSFVPEEQGTNVLYPLDWPQQLGEIALSYPYGVRQAASLGHSTDKELAWLTIHGTLQLLGYRHYTDEEAAHMEGLEQIALRELGFGGS